MPLFEKPTPVHCQAPKDSHLSHTPNTFTSAQHPHSLNPLQHQIKSQISLIYHQLKSPKSHHLNQVWMRLSMIHPGIKFSISGPAKQGNMLSSSKIQWWDRHRVPVTKVPIQKGRKWKEKRSHPSQAILESSRASFIRFQDLVISLCVSRLQPLCLRFQPLG